MSGSGHDPDVVYLHGFSQTEQARLMRQARIAESTIFRNVDYTGPNGNTGSVDSVRTRTDDGFTRSTTVTNGQGETATRDLSVARDKEAGTVTREANYTTIDGRQGSMSDVVQRTDDGYTRDTSRTLPNGTTQTRNVDVSCDKDAATCIKQVVVGKEP